MARHLFKLEAFVEFTLIFLAICRSYETTNTDRQAGFLSIDCGRTQGAYNDSIGLSWDNDEMYIRTGKNSRRSFKVDSNLDNYIALGDFRYFPEPRSKHCYDFQTTKNISYLIRAMFYYDDTQSDELKLPIQFNVAIGGTNWFTVTYDNQVPAGGLVKEGIFYSPGYFYFCLLPMKGVPFISSLELRPLARNIYAGTNLYLSTLIRYNFGAPSDVPSVRHPDDPFDRLWESGFSSYYFVNISFPSQRDANLNADANYVPARVMQNAMKCNLGRHTCGVPYFLNLTAQVATAYAVLYFADPNASESGGWEMIVSLNGIFLDPFNVTDRAIMRTYPNAILETAQIELFFSSPSKVPFVNAMEVYEENIFDFSTIDPPDLYAVSAMQNSFNLTDFQGDPCTTVPYDWLTCSRSYHVFNVISVMLSNVSGSGLLIDNVNSSASMSSLAELSITHSDVNELTFDFLINNFTKAGLGLLKLDLSYNDIKSIPQAVDRISQNKLAYLNLSHNAVEGQLSSLINMQYFKSLKTLNLSYNALTSLPTQWSKASKLQVLDLSHNNLAGSISSLDILVGNSSQTMRELYISDNDLTGLFSSQLYFSDVTNLEIANFDRNQIQGVLNLSAWYNSLQEAALTSNSSILAMNQLFSFVNNSILGIYPRAEILQPTIDILLNSPTFKKTGVLLGGNPYCKGAKSQTQRYLCRSTVNDPYLEQRKKKSWLIVIGIPAGVFAVLVCIVLLVIIWNLSNKVSSLRQIQQALADQKVHPPFFSYTQLKSATGNFHEDNKLGKGTYGVVYKGVQEDKTTFAVKKLFNSQQGQVLNEFLNEVVLITGIKHRNLVQLKGCCINDNQRILVYEHVENGNLAEALWGGQERGILDWQQRFKICVGVASGLAYLHEELEPRIIHRDIKPANILLDKKFNPKIADFGLARPFLDEQTRIHSTHLAGTLGYWAPEYAMEGKLTEKADVFSFGTLALEIISGRKCIDYSLPQEEVFLRDWAQKLQSDGNLLELLQSELRQNCVEAEVIRVIDTALVCVELDPKRRARMSQVVTMLLGSTDVTNLRDDCELQNSAGPSFRKNDPSLENSGEGEASDQSPLLNWDRHSSLQLKSMEGSTRSDAIIELGTITFRKMKSFSAFVGRTKAWVSPR